MLSKLFTLAATYKIPTDGIAPGGITNVGTGLSRVIVLLLGLIGSLSAIFVIVGGLLMVLAAGNPARFKQGRETVLYAVIGLIVAIGGYAVVVFVTSYLG